MRAKNRRVEAELADRAERTRNHSRRSTQTGPDLDCLVLIYARVRVWLGSRAPAARRRHRCAVPDPWTIHGDQWYCSDQGEGLDRSVRAGVRAGLRAWRHGAAGALDDDVVMAVESLDDYPAGLRALAGAVRHFAARGQFYARNPRARPPGAVARRKYGQELLTMMLHVAATRNDVCALLAAGVLPDTFVMWHPGPFASMLAGGQLPAGLVRAIDFDREEIMGDAVGDAARLLDGPARRLLVPGALARMGHACWETLQCTQCAQFAQTADAESRRGTVALLRLSVRVGALLAEELTAQPAAQPAYLAGQAGQAGRPAG
jgi:hypothetical protein